MPNLRIKRFAQLGVGLYAERVEHLGEKGPRGGGEYDVHDLRIAEAVVTNPLHISGRDRRRVSRDPCGEVHHGSVCGIEIRSAWVSRDGPHRYVIATDV